jgi:hypothetical protein
MGAPDNFVTRDTDRDRPAVASSKQERIAMTVRADYLPKGIQFTRLAIALALAKGKEGPARNIAANRWGEESQPARLLKSVDPAQGINGLLTKSAVVAGSTASANWASDLVSAEQARSEFFSLVRERSLLGRLPGLRRIPLETRLVTEASGFSAAWVAEGAAVPLSAATYEDNGRLPRLKVSALAVFSDELLESLDPAAELFIRDGLVSAVVEAIDLSLVDPANSGTANVKPASITNGVTGISSTGDGLQDVRNLVDAFPLTGDLSRAVLIGAPVTFAAMHDPVFLPGLGVRGGEAMGIPAIPSNQAGDDLILVDPGSVALGEDAMELRASNEATIEMSDAPTQNATTPTATTQTSLWQCDSTAILCNKFLNWSVQQPAVSLVTGVAGS